MFSEPIPAPPGRPVIFFGPPDTSSLLLNQFAARTGGGARGRWLSPPVRNPDFGRFSPRKALLFVWLRGSMDPKSFSPCVPVSPAHSQHHTAAVRGLWGSGPVGFLDSRKRPEIDSPTLQNIPDISEMVRSPAVKSLSVQEDPWTRKCTNFRGPTRMKKFNTMNDATYGSPPQV